MKKIHTKQLAALSTKIKAIRVSRNMTQVELAARMDKDVRTIKRLESRTYNPRFATILEVADALGVPVKDLLL